MGNIKWYASAFKIAIVFQTTIHISIVLGNTDWIKAWFNLDLAILNSQVIKLILHFNKS